MLVQQVPMRIPHLLRINGGTERTSTGYGWQIAGLRLNGDVAIVHNDGDHTFTHDTMPMDEFLTHNPRFTDNAIVTHPSPASNQAADGWRVSAPRDATTEVTLQRAGATSVVPVKPVIDANLDILRWRIEILPDS